MLFQSFFKIVGASGVQGLIGALQDIDEIHVNIVSLRLLRSLAFVRGLRDN